MIVTFDGALGATGYLVADQAPLELGLIITKSEDPQPKRLRLIYQQVLNILSAHKADMVILEEKFVGKNPRTALDLSRVDGVIMLAAGTLDIPVLTFTPSEIKKSATGSGRASKEEIRQAMVERYKDYPAITGQLRPEWVGSHGRNKCDDKADALAIWHTYVQGVSPQTA